MKTGEVFEFSAYTKKTDRDKKALVLKLEVFKYEDDEDFKFVYSLKKGQHKASDDFIAFSLAYVIEDILRYTSDPCDILELTEEMIERLGYEQRGDLDD